MIILLDLFLLSLFGFSFERKVFKRCHFMVRVSRATISARQRNKQMVRIHQLGVNRKRTRTVLDKTLNGFLLYYFVSHEVIDIPFIITGLAIHFISNLWDLRYCLYVWIQTCQEIHISRFIFGHHGPFFHSSDKRKAILKIRSLTVQNKKFTLFLSKTRIVFVGNSSTCIFTLIHSILKRISGV